MTEGPSSGLRPGERVLALIERHGWNATAFQTLEAGYSYFFHGPDAVVAYVDTGRAWVAAGAPIAPGEAIADVAEAFVAAAGERGRRCCFFATEHRLHEAAAGRLRAVRIGEQPVWDPREWSEALRGHRSVREQLRRARAKGVSVRLATPAELVSGPTHEAMHALAARWLATRRMAPMGFLVRIELSRFPAHRRCFLAERGGRIVALAGVVPVPARNGWLIEDLIRDPGSPNGTAELLVDGVMRWAAATGSRWVTLGLAPLAGEVAPGLRAARRGGGLLFDFEGLRTFKAKLRPGSWSSISIAHPPSQGAVVSVLDALEAFTAGGFLRFALRSLRRGPPAVLWVLLALLVPWTVLLAAAPVRPWFPSAWVKWAWVAFDVALAAAMLRLLRRGGRRLAGALALAVSVDAALTWLQAGLWNAPRIESAGGALMVAVACAGPTLGALVLWGAYRTADAGRRR